MKLQSRAWLTSFGDLLTLLLCFIVAAVYQSAKQDQQKKQLYQIDRPVEAAKIRQGDASGKQIASNLVTEYPHLALKLFKGDFGPAYAALNDKGVLEVKNFAERTEGGLEVGICNVGFDFSESVFESLENQLEPRPIKISIGSEICRNLKDIGSETLEDTILLTAYVKQSHG